MLKFLVFLLSVSYSTLSGEKQDSALLKPRFGLFLDYSFIGNFSSFRKLPNVPSCCPEYTQANGRSFEFGGIGEYYIEKLYFLSLRTGFDFESAPFRYIESSNVIIDGKSTPAKFEHYLDLDFARFVLSPAIGFMPYRYFIFTGGFSLYFPLSGTYYQKEDIIEPKDRGSFPDGTRRRNESSGDLTGFNSIQASIDLGVKYPFPLNKRGWLYLFPELKYSLQFTNMISGLDWKNHKLSLGISVMYIEPPPAPPEPEPPIEPPMPEMPLPPVQPPLTVELSAVIFDSAKQEQVQHNVKIEDFVSINMRPLLNYIFFDENSSEIPSRYISITPEEAKNYKLSSLQNLDAITTYYHVLNIFGKRLSDNPEAVIKIIGTNAGIDDEKRNKQLSEARAETVRNYLRDVWNIDEKRMHLMARNKPKQSSANVEKEGDEENRRVEIICDFAQFNKPVLTYDTIRIITPITIRFKPRVKSGSAIKKWELNLYQGSVLLSNRTGASMPPDSIDWKPSNEASDNPVYGGNLYFDLLAEDVFEQSAKTATDSIPVERLTVERKRIEAIADQEFDYYSLILFDYGSSKLQKAHKDVIDFIKSKITPDAKIEIYGYTDKIGDEDINRRISERRAKVVARRLDIPDIQVAGLGETKLLYDNKLPEGRFYCRTVTINIITPIKNGKK
ncbi:MAG: OmpA family protein [Ignavibacteria bacterium]|nr:OmpA family protein [Ignavibacteria bacterium]